jgi:hypothetical protein
MSIYRLSVSVISRAQNRSAVAAAAYRAGQCLQDLKDCVTGKAKIHDYRNRGGVIDSGIIAPDHTPPSLRDRASLWNAAESAENRKNSRIAREAVIALPHELTDEQRKNLTESFALYLVARYGVAVDYAIHRPDKKGDQRNHHAHIMFTTRIMTAAGLGAKTRALDDKHQGGEEIEAIRQEWERLCNAALAAANIAQRVDRRSLAARGVHRIPEPKQGKQGTARTRRRKPSKAAAERIAVKAYNAAVERLKPSARRKQVRKDKATLRTAQILRETAQAQQQSMLCHAWHTTTFPADLLTLRTAWRGSALPQSPPEWEP